MNRDIIQLREVITKLVPMLSGRGLRVTQQGSRAYVRINPKTRKPEKVNIPNLPDDASSDFVSAIHGFIDHEVAHVLITDFDVRGDYADHDPRAARLHNLHNIMEDTMIEREICKIFPGSRRNLSNVRKHFLTKISEPAIAGAQDQKEEFQYLIVPVMRALAGHEEMQEWMDQKKYWDHPIVKDVIGKLSPQFLSLVKTASKTAETLVLAKELESILYPPPEQQQQQQQGESQDKPEKEAGQGDGDGERDHSKSDENPDDGDKGESASEGSEDGEEQGDAKSSKKDKKEDDREDADAGDDEDADSEGEKEDGDESKGADDDGDESKSADGDEDGDESDGEGGDAGSDNDDGDDADEGSDGSAGKGESAEDDANDDGDSADDDIDGSGGDGSNSDDVEGDGDGGLDPLPTPVDVDGEANDSLETENDDAEGSGGVGNGLGKSVFDFDDDAFEAVDLSNSVAALITTNAEDVISQSEYTVFTRDYDVIKPLEVPEINDKWVPEMDAETDRMAGTMQKDIERIMASQSHVIRTPGHKTGKLHSPSLYRVLQNDPRVFTQKQEHRSKDTAVTLLIDNSGSMGGRKLHTAMLSAYALSRTLDRVNIAHEVIGFTTGGYTEASRRVFNEARAEKVDFCRITPIVMPIFKTFDERLGPVVKKRIAYMMNAQKGICANVDGESLQIAAERLMRRKEQRKVIIVLSDGAPSGASKAGPHLRLVVKNLDKMGIECVGVGIQDSNVQYFYPNHTVLQNINDLPGKIMDELKRILA